MLTALYYAIQGSGDQKEYRRQAVNYCFVVGSFVVWCYYLSPSNALYPDLVNLDNHTQSHYHHGLLFL